MPLPSFKLFPIRASEWILPPHLRHLVLGASFLLQGAPGGTYMPYPVLEESEKGGASRRRWRKFSTDLPLKLQSVQSVLLIQCNILLCMSLEFFHLATKILQLFNRPSQCKPPSSSWNYPSTLCSSWVFLWIPQVNGIVCCLSYCDWLISLLTISFHFIYCCKWQVFFHF